MSEIVNIPSNYQSSEVMNNIVLPDEKNNTQQTLNESKRLQKNVSNIKGSKDKKRKREDKQVQKKK